ncbi:MAG: DMT family transporter [Candidatus Riflebacteria bacterium]|jgi:drug/metabolite transporter (DMT)-like permease|nr:DMT family transporter [Candidatus Riflebacteria bacterium]
METLNQERPGNLKAAFYLTFTLFAFSSIEIIANPVRHDVPPMLMNFWRFLIGAAILLPALLYRRYNQLKQLQGSDMIKLTLLGCMNIILAMGAHSLCIKYAKASTAAILISANPIATNFFSWLILKEKMGLKRIFSLVLGATGIVLIAARADGAVDTLPGVIAGIFSMSGFGLYTVLSKKMVQKHGGLLVLVMSCVPTLVIYLPVLYFFDQGFWPPAHSWPNLLGMGIIGTGLGYLTFMKCLEFLSAGRTSYLFFFKPAVAMFLAWAFLGESISRSAIFGTILIMTGIISEISRATATKPPVTA